MSFQYEPLDPSRREIRLLTLLPSWDGKINGRLHVVSLDLEQQPEFLALSYVWGHEDEPEPITINGAGFKVKKNLKAALLRLQKSEPQLIWIDAICIDQGNDPESIREKNFQIPLMRDIYTQASRVIAWLGEGNDKIEALFRWVHHARPEANKQIKFESISPEVAPPLSSDRTRTSCQDAETSIEEQRKLDIDDKNISKRDLTSNKDSRIDDLSRLTEGGKAYLGFLDFLLLPYWQRMWTFQEISLPKSDPICVYGTHTANLSVFLDTSKDSPVPYKYRRHIPKAELVDLEPARYGVSETESIRFTLTAGKIRVILDGILIARHKNMRGDGGLELPALIKATIGRKCHDPRDRIYALLGLDSRRSLFHCNVDYGKDILVEEVLTQAGISSVEFEDPEGAWLFHFFGMRPTRFSDNLSLPSWIPDFDSHCPISSLIKPAAKSLLQRSAHDDTMPATHQRDCVVVVGQPGVGVVVAGEPKHSTIPASLHQLATFNSSLEQKSSGADALGPDGSEEWQTMKLPASKSNGPYGKGEECEYVDAHVKKDPTRPRLRYLSGNLPSLRMTARKLGQCQSPRSFAEDYYYNAEHVMEMIHTQKNPRSWNLLLETMDAVPALNSSARIPRDIFAGLQTEAAFEFAKGEIERGFQDTTAFLKGLFESIQDSWDAQTQTKEETLKYYLRVFIGFCAFGLSGRSVFKVLFQEEMYFSFVGEPVEEGDVVIMPLAPYFHPIVLREEKRTGGISADDGDEKPFHGTCDDIIWHRMVGAAFIRDLLEEESEMVAQVAKLRVEDFYIR
ncbi:hypothetical protein PFICI_12666 [Pestalotiopsis fici W106-1]|uniref:Heterokaryon incompatibility domain-containing protein n=1 Tax=Pestalotiopsis fici (strain W106-1 / CGMCC3.15140) TaxID=1229662 RepID=W3WRH7_PESFW|nr:uncharacterized protein PFICI_12666 [Pestalotiopsis fici W106-1]ETS75722.1 hypothetical protein PFICI_12666 [Pestalotiopsis fici W106-1]